MVPANRSRPSGFTVSGGTCPCDVLESSQLKDKMRRGRGVGVLMVMTALILLPVAAGARPPDPTWIPGIYDGADGDDVISVVTETPASHHGVAHHLLVPALLSEDVVMRGLRMYESWPALQPPRGPPDRCRRNPTRSSSTPTILLQLVSSSSRTSRAIAERASALCPVLRDNHRGARDATLSAQVPCRRL